MKKFAMWAAISLILLPGAPVAARPGHYCMGQRATIVGTEGDDRIEGTWHSDVIAARGGWDYVKGGQGDDLICLGPGGRFRERDQAVGDKGRDRLLGGAGQDSLSGGKGKDILWGGVGHDRAEGGGKPDLIIGGPGRDHLHGEEGPDVLKGRGGPDHLEGKQGEDLLVGGNEGAGGDIVDYYRARSGVVVDLRVGRARGGRGVGVDRLIGIEGVQGSDHFDRLIGNSKDNLLEGHFGGDVLKGKAGDDCLNPGPDVNRAYGNEGYDAYSANPGFFSDCVREPFEGPIVGDVLRGGLTLDLAAGTAETLRESSTLFGIEAAFGTYGADTLMGDAGRNYLYGGPGRDSLEGRENDDRLDGAGSYDNLDGGDGTDACRNGEVETSCE